jgi:HK97 family phage major capsid protein
MSDELAGMSLRQVRDSMDEKRRKVQSLRDKNGGTIVGMTGTDADEVRELMGQLNSLGERNDVLLEQQGADEEIKRLGSYFDEPAQSHPGHQTGKPAAKEPAKPRDIGGRFLASDAWKAFKAEGATDRVETIPLESLWPQYQGIGEVPSMHATLFDTTGYPSQPQFLPTPIEVLYQGNNIGPLFAQGTTNQNTVRYVTETVTSTGAAETAESGTKPEAQLSMASTDEPIRKIAVVLPLTDESLEDVPFLQSYINARLRLFVQLREDSQLLNGNGTTPNLKGILNRAGINTATTYSIGGANPDQALVEAVFHAQMRVRDAFLEPDAVVMKPSTWEICALAKDSNRNYLLGGPGSAGYAGNNVGGNLMTANRLWGIPVTLNANMPAQVAANKDVLVGAFAAGGMVIRRSGIDMAMSDSHSTFFYENKIAIRAEERLGLAIWRPAAFAAVTSAA